MLPFETSEYLKRIDNTKRHMAKAGLDVLLAADTANMNYLTGYGRLGPSIRHNWSSSGWN